MTETQQLEHLNAFASKLQRAAGQGSRVMEKYMEWGMDQHKVDLPEGASGHWRVEKYEITEQMASLHNLRCAINAHRGAQDRVVCPGTYTRLCHDCETVMSDTPAEIRDHLTAIERAKGHCLINGLGIGMVAVACLKKDEVTKVTVIEFSADVISLVGPTLQARWGDRLEIVHASAFDYKPPKGVRYGMVWHDIWTFICSDNVEEMKRLHRKYGRRADWQGSWCRHQC